MDYGHLSLGNGEIGPSNVGLLEQLIWIQTCNLFDAGLLMCEAGKGHVG
jgi:hypothetical protein